MSIYQIVAKATSNDETELRNIHHYQFSSYVPDTSQLQEAVDAIDTAYKDNLVAYFSDTVEMYGYDVRRVDEGNLPTLSFVPTAGVWSGTNSTSPIPPQVAAMVTWKANEAFPRTTRAYMFPFGVSHVTGTGRVSANAKSALEDFATDMLQLSITAGVDADKQAVTYGGSPRITVEDNDVNFILVRNVYRTQRRRTVNVGI
jgi:hypothetical protein